MDLSITENNLILCPVCGTHCTQAGPVSISRVSGSDDRFSRATKMKFICNTAHCFEVVFETDDDQTTISVTEIPLWGEDE